MSLEKDVVGRIDAEWIAQEAYKLVDIPSVTLEEKAACDCFEDQLGRLGLKVDVREITPGRNNHYARIEGTGDGPTLLLNGHLDTIPIGDCVEVGREGDRITGRGSTEG